MKLSIANQNHTLRTYGLFVAGLFLLFQAGCAGPTTPFGPVGEISSELKQKSFNYVETSNEDLQERHSRLEPQFHFSPKRLVLHEKRDFIITLHDPLMVTKESTIELYYNEVNLSQLLRRNGHWRFSEDGTQVQITLKDFRPHPRTENQIQFRYQRTPDSATITRDYLPPNCDLYAMDPIRAHIPFDQADLYLKEIERQARESQINPALLAALVAQESSFNPKAFSKARAVGLTQITSLAEKEVLKMEEKARRQWPRDRRIASLPYPVVKLMIGNDHITERQDWRLDPLKSLHGGIVYLNYVDDYWKSGPANLLRQTYFHKSSSMIDLLLASYNSGPARVKFALEKRGQNFLYDPSLREAKRYVDRIKSYCYHFAHTEEDGGGDGA